jgi:hypothetical protein
MSRRCLFPFAVVFFLPGCVPVTEPLSDASTSEPDMRLVGKWKSDGQSMTIDVPVGKGNPKGLMRIRNSNEAEETGGMWFYTTRIGKQTYANICLAAWAWFETQEIENVQGFSTVFKGAQFEKAGDFEKWLKDEDKRYLIGKLSFNGDKLVLDLGAEFKVASLMKMGGIERRVIRNRWSGEQVVIAYRVPAGWLAKFLDENKPEAIYNGSHIVEYEREMKPKEVQSIPQQELPPTPTPIQIGANTEVAPIPSPTAPSTPVEEPSVTAPEVKQTSGLPQWVLPAVVVGAVLSLLVLWRLCIIIKVRDL